MRPPSWSCSIRTMRSVSWGAWSEWSLGSGSWSRIRPGSFVSGHSPQPFPSPPRPPLGGGWAGRGAPSHVRPCLTPVQTCVYPCPSLASRGGRHVGGESGLPIVDSRVGLPTGERQYHIDLGPGELAEYILLPGDPHRTARITTRLDSIQFDRRNREFASVTGMYKGLRVSIVSTGIGADNVEIVIAEILAITERPTIVRVGSSGGLQPGTPSGDPCVTPGAGRPA